MTYLGYRIIKHVIFHKKIDSNQLIDLCDFDDICVEAGRLVNQKRIKSITILVNSLSFKLTNKGFFGFVWMVFKSFVNYIFALIIAVIMVSFFSSAVPSYIKLVEAWDSQNSLDTSFYAAQIGFYLTLVVVLISMITLIASSRSRNDIMLID